MGIGKMGYMELMVPLVLVSFCGSCFVFGGFVFD